MKGSLSDLSPIEHAVNMDNLRDQKLLANLTVHAGSSSVSWTFGMPPEWHSPLAGATNIDLAEPGHKIAVSLVLALRPFLGSRLDFEASIDAFALVDLAGTTQRAFEAADELHARAMDAERKEALSARAQRRRQVASASGPSRRSRAHTRSG